MPIHNAFTDEQECALLQGYLAGLTGEMAEPPESYRGNTVLLVCWYWGYNQAVKYRTVH